MEGYTSEKEQIEALRKWWRENGKSIITGLMIGTIAILGVRYWLDYRHGQEESASVEYQQLLGELKAGDDDAVLKRSAYLISQYSDTPYSVAAALASARLELKKDDIAAAKAHLQWVIDHAAIPALQHIARLRLTRILLQEGQYQQSLTLLNAVDPENFRPAYEALKGDAYIAMGNPVAARTAYRQALAGTNLSAEQRSLLQMKLDELGAAEAS